MAKAKTNSSSGASKGQTRKRRGVKIRPTELGPTDLLLASPEGDVMRLADAIRDDIRSRPKTWLAPAARPPKETEICMANDVGGP